MGDWERSRARHLGGWRELGETGEPGDTGDWAAPCWMGGVVSEDMTGGEILSLMLQLTMSASCLEVEREGG